MNAVKSNPAAEKSAEKSTEKTAEKTAEKSTFIDVLIGQIGDLAGDRRLAREANAYVRYQMAGLSRGLIDYELTAAGIATPDGDQLVAEIVASLTAVAKKSADRDTAALLRRFCKIFEADYACVRTAKVRRART